MRIVCPRMIRGNRGDLASRFGIISEISASGLHKITVFCDSKSDILPINAEIEPYGRQFNLIPKRRGWIEIIKSDIIIWTGGIDLQDDSSILKLIHTLIVFLIYKILAKKIYVLMQGAGPITGNVGKFLTKCIVGLTTWFVVRDKGSYKLLSTITNNKRKIILGFDGIFCGKFYPEVIEKSERDICEDLLQKTSDELLIGFNIRRWFHFSNSIIPCHLNKNKFINRAYKPMMRIMDASISSIKSILLQYPAKIILISMYEPGLMSWEDEQSFLIQIKSAFPEDKRVRILEKRIGLQAFCYLISKLNLMIGMRLHSTLIALRFGVPAITLNYTLKGRDIFSDLGFSNYVLEIEDFMNDPLQLTSKVSAILSDNQIHQNIQNVNKNAAKHNRSILNSILNKTELKIPLEKMKLYENPNL